VSIAQVVVTAGVGIDFSAVALVIQAFIPTVGLVPIVRRASGTVAAGQKSGGIMAAQKSGSLTAARQSGSTD
jgi:hypothetical protein